ncbi:MAG: alpha/beta fold hydrolase [Polyangiaceae bacterium]
MKKAGLASIGVFALALVACSSGNGKGDADEPVASSSATSTASATSSATPASKHAAPERWAATAALPSGLEDMTVTFEEGDAGWQATLEVPNKGVKVELTRVTHTDDKLEFTLAKPNTPESMWQVFVFPRAAGSTTVDGDLVIAGQPFYIRMALLKEGEAPRSVLARPQTPKPPFPYESREVTVDAPEDGKLAGTLTYPKGQGPFPAVLLISGSGQQDRDNTIYGHKAFLVLADRLTKEGFAVLRLDDRMTGKTQGKVNSLDTELGDFKAALDYLLTQPEVDAKRVGLIGHSVGGGLAPVIAVKSGKVAFIVSLAGTPLPGAELVPIQLEADLAARGAPEELRKKMANAQRKLGAAMVKGDTKALREAVRVAIQEFSEAAQTKMPEGKELEQAIDAKLKEIANPWTQTYFKLDPRLAWQKYKNPVLLLVGDKDTQVPAKVTVDEVTKALKKAKNDKLTTHILPGLNHLFQPAKLGILDEYPRIETTFDQGALDELAAWLVKQAGVK